MTDDLSHYVQTLRAELGPKVTPLTQRTATRPIRCSDTSDTLLGLKMLVTFVDEVQDYGNVGLAFTVVKLQLDQSRVIIAASATPVTTSVAVCHFYLASAVGYIADCYHPELDQRRHTCWTHWILG